MVLFCQVILVGITSIQVLIQVYQPVWEVHCMNDLTKRDQIGRTADYINQVGFNLYRQLETQNNLVFSPFGIYCVLRMLYEGARGETRRTISQLLYPNSEGVPDDEFQVLIKWLQSAFQLSIVNSIWIQEGYSFKPDFLETVQSTMRVETANLDFEGNLLSACEEINVWVAEQTNGRINKVISPESLSDMTRGILGNALFFKANWEREFKKLDPEPFYLLDGSHIEVPMMGTYFFAPNAVIRSDYWAVELSYRKSQQECSSFSMILLMPAYPGIEALSALERRLSNFEVLIPEEEKMHITLTMPLFMILGHLPLVPDLVDIRIGEVFKTGADFTGISDELGFHVDQLFQNSYIQVDEYGTEAGAVTFAETVGGYIDNHLTIDRPFLYLLIERVSGLILFMGKVLNPLLAS
jgi:serpin B